MKKFDLGAFIGDPKLRHLVSIHYQRNEIRPITESQIVMGTNLAVKDPYTDRLVLLDESAETRDEDGNWISTIYLVEGIFTSRTMAEKLAALKPGEDVHFITNSRLDGYSIRRLYLLGADLFIARRWECELSMYDATGNLMNIHDMD